MKKNLIILSAFLSTGIVFSQVGINTPDPKATMDITAKAPKGVTTSPEGLLVPRVDRERAQSMVGIQVSTLIYVDDVTTGTQTNTAINIDTTGYYYFDGRFWVKLNSFQNSIDSINMYNSDGSLSANRTVTQDDKTLAFTATRVNAFSVDGNTFSVDAANNRVGLRTSAPSATLDIVGTTFGIKNSAGTGSWDNLWFNVDSYGPSINASGAENGMTFNVGRNVAGTYGDSNQVLATVATMRPEGNMGIGTTTPNPNAILDLTSTNRGFLPPRLTTAQRNALTTRPAGLMIYNVTTNCMDFWNSAAWVSTCAVAAPVQGTITTLNCAGATNTGTLSRGLIASGVSSVIPYTGGNGGSYGGQTVASTGVTGLTATLTAGSFANGSGTLTYTITGTPSAAGTANFAINIGGVTCTLSRPVVIPVGAIASLNCAGATQNGTLTGGTAAAGVSSVISYTGGNGGTYAAQTVTSTGVPGLTATLTAGSFANGNGTVTYTITGTPAASGTASFTINLGGQTCILTRTVAQAATPPPSPGINCTADSFLIPYTANGGTSNGTINGVPVTATISSANIIQGPAVSTCFGAAQQSTFRTAANTQASLTIRFNRRVSNARVYDVFLGAGGSIVRYYNNGVEVNPTGNIQTQNCSVTGFGSRPVAARPSAGVWYNEIRITASSSGNIPIICVGSVQ